MVGTEFLFMTVALFTIVFVPVAWIRRKKEIARREEIWDTPVEENLQAEKAVLVSKEEKMIKTNRLYISCEEERLLKAKPNYIAQGDGYSGHVMIYTATFLTDSGVQAKHQVPYEIYTALTEGQTGLLVTLNDAFLDFGDAEE